MCLVVNHHILEFVPEFCNSRKTEILRFHLEHKPQVSVIAQIANVSFPPIEKRQPYFGMDR